MVTLFLRWWHTSCRTCRILRNCLYDVGAFLWTIASPLFLLGFFLIIYWIFFDTDPVLYYGPNGRSEFFPDRIIIHLDAVRLRDCDAKVYRKITGCGQIDLPTSWAVTPLGASVPPYAIPMSTLMQSFSREMLSGQVCTYQSIIEGYCNPAQKLLRVPIVTVSPPISFIPVPRAKTYQDGP